MPVTSVAASVLALVLAALSINISRLRIRYKVSFGFTQQAVQIARFAHWDWLKPGP